MYFLNKIEVFIIIVQRELQVAKKAKNDSKNIKTSWDWKMITALFQTKCFSILIRKTIVQVCIGRRPSQLWKAVWYQQLISYFSLKYLWYLAYNFFKICYSSLISVRVSWSLTQLLKAFATLSRPLHHRFFISLSMNVLWWGLNSLVSIGVLAYYGFPVK